MDVARVSARDTDDDGLHELAGVLLAHATAVLARLGHIAYEKAPIQNVATYLVPHAAVCQCWHSCLFATEISPSFYIPQINENLPVAGFTVKKFKWWQANHAAIVQRFPLTNEYFFSKFFYTLCQNFLSCNNFWCIRITNFYPFSFL